MASRWMNQMRARERAFRHRQGMESMTDAERKLYRRKMNESIESYIARLENVAAFEQKYAVDWWRHLARVLTVIAAPLDQVERDLISQSCKLGRAVADTETAILRYRRLTGRHQHANQ